MSTTNTNTITGNNNSNSSNTSASDSTTPKPGNGTTDPAAAGPIRRTAAPRATTAAAVTAEAGSDAPRLAVVPDTRKVMVVLPSGTAADWLTLSQVLTWHGLMAATPRAEFPVRRGPWGWLTGWFSRGLLDGVRNRWSLVARAAGGRRSRLDLAAMAAQARDEAVARWQTWSRFIAATTPTPRTWETFVAQHQRDPKKLTLSEARRQFEAQPGVLAMLAHNGYPAAAQHLDPYELEALQAGEAVYVALHWQSAVAGDALITPEGRLLQPASASVADRLRYLAEANGVIRAAALDQHLVCVHASTLATAQP